MCPLLSITKTKAQVPPALSPPPTPHAQSSAVAIFGLLPTRFHASPRRISLKPAATHVTPCSKTPRTSHWPQDKVQLLYQGTPLGILPCKLSRVPPQSPLVGQYSTVVTSVDCGGPGCLLLNFTFTHRAPSVRLLNSVSQSVNQD